MSCSGDMQRFKTMEDDLWGWYKMIYFGDCKEPNQEERQSFSQLLFDATFDQFQDVGMFKAMLVWSPPFEGRAGAYDWEAYAYAVLGHVSFKAGIFPLITADRSLFAHADRPNYEDFVLLSDLARGKPATYEKITEVQLHTKNMLFS